MDEHKQTTHQDPLINLLFDDGLQNALPRIAEILMNAAMLLERETHIGAALATMYVEGVSTRRVTRIMEQMCGFEISSGQVSNLNKQLDVEFVKWRTRPLPEIAHMPADHLVHFVMDAVSRLDLGPARVNVRGTGDRQFPPSMMLGLLVYSYATGVFSSRRIERSTYDSVPVRRLCADTHPDHDTLCKFRRENRELLESVFEQVLEYAARAKVLQVGNITLALDGTKVLANASKHSAMSHGHAVKQMNLLDEEIATLLAKAEEADSVPLRDDPGIPEEIRRREDRRAEIQVGLDGIRARAGERHRQEKAAHEEKTEGKGPEATRARPEGQGPVKLHRPRKPDHESLQRAGRSRGRKPAHRRQAAQRRAQKKAGTRARPRSPQPRGGKRGSSARGQRLLQRGRRDPERPSTRPGQGSGTEGAGRPRRWQPPEKRPDPGSAGKSGPPKNRARRPNRRN